MTMVASGITAGWTPGDTSGRGVRLITKEELKRKIKEFDIDLIKLIRDRFKYEDDGQLIYKISPSNFIQSGTVAGTLDVSGYIHIGINGKYYGAHRIIFALHYGYCPEYIDHINGIKTDNRICNLRKCDKRTNNQNSKLRIDNSSNVKGVHWSKSNKKWHVQISRLGCKRHVGFFDDIELAELVAQECRSKYHGVFANNGEACAK